MADAARQRRLEPEPGLDGAIDFRCLIDQRPGTGPDPRRGRVKHRADLAGALHRLDVPGERDEVAPVAFVMEERGRPGDVRRGDGGAELCEPAGGALCGCLIHCSRLRRADATVSGTNVAPPTAAAEPLRMK